MSADELSRAVGDAMQPVVEDISRAFQAVCDALGGAEGIVAYVAAREQWETEHPGLKFGQECNCWCRKWGHDDGACDDEAETFIVASLQGEPVQVAMCVPCATLTEAAQRRS